METFDSFNLQALTETIAVINDAISYKGVNLPAIVSNVVITESLEDGGIMQMRGLTVVLPLTISTVPAVGEKLIYNGKGYRVLEVDQDGASYNLKCDTDAK